MKSFKPQHLTSDELLHSLLEYTTKIAEERELDKLLVLMNDLGKEILVCDRCTLWLVEQDEVWTKVAHGLEELRMPKSRGLVGECVTSGLSLIVNDPYNDPRFNQEVDQITGYQTDSILVLPLFKNDGTLLGVYQAINKSIKGEGFTKNDVQRLQLIATFSSKSLESALLYKEIEHTQMELVYMLGEAGESRSKETGNHVKRVGEYSYILAKALGLSAEESELIRLAAPLHDLGKVGIPDAILNKPGRLTFEEFEIMKTHAELGYNILNKSKRRILKAAAIQAYEHQEKYNGTGYPRGLKGKEIHLHGRICAVADVFDALSNDRCYKKAWPMDKVLNLFEEERGEHFDPELVDLLFNNLDKFKKVMVELADKFDD
jgi:response regulator RpfG family c-di-GMP phosphodiesterase